MRNFWIFVLVSIPLLGAMRVSSSVELDLEPSLFSDYMQEDFESYLVETRNWIRENRVFRSDDHELEIELNAPSEFKPDNPTGTAVLLVHGLSDSPYSFSDIAQRLSDQGVLVRTVLLPGHGGKPADLMLPTIENWLELISHHTNLLMEEADEVWVGGFSTGANLALIESIDNPKVAGTLLFSPAIASRKPLDFLAPLAKYVMDWADVDPEESITRFDSLTMNGAALYYETSKMVRNRLASSVFDRPVFVTLSESDSVVDSEGVYDLFHDRFSYPKRQLLWFGEHQWEDEKVRSYSMKLPEKRISTGSHMSVLYSPNNAFYGQDGIFRICNNGQSEAEEDACRSGAETWFSSFDYVEPDKIHARLTWNPYFEETLKAVLAVIGSGNSQLK